MTDNLASGAAAGAWTFSAAVAAQFDEHVTRSIRGYSSIQSIIGRVADWAAPDSATIADVGCATGATFDVIQRRHPSRRFNLYGYDTSPDMIAAARGRLSEADPTGERLSAELLCVDARDGLAHTDADLTVAVFTLQFLPPSDRLSVLEELHARSARHGVLLIAEKTIPSDPRWALIAAEALWEDKRISGFPGEEIVAKTESLRGVLRPLDESLCIAEPVLAGWRAPFVLWAEWNWRLVGYFYESTPHPEPHATVADQRRP